MKIDLSKIVIRKVENGDIETMANYRLDYLTELQGERGEDYKQKLRTELIGFLKSEIENARFFALLAEFNGEILSFGAMVVKRIPGDFNQSSYLEGDILNMYTLPKFRRMGISSLILKRLLEEARELGISKVALHTSKDGEKLYRKYGFSEPIYPVLERLID